MRGSPEWHASLACGASLTGAHFYLLSRKHLTEIHRLVVLADKIRRRQGGVQAPHHPSPLAPRILEILPNAQRGVATLVGA